MPRGVTHTQSCTWNPNRAADCPNCPRPYCVLAPGSGACFPARIWWGQVWQFMRKGLRTRRCYPGMRHLWCSSPEMQSGPQWKPCSDQPLCPGLAETQGHWPELERSIRDSQCSSPNDSRWVLWETDSIHQFLIKFPLDLPREPDMGRTACFLDSRKSTGCCGLFFFF